MKLRNREVNIFSMSALDLFASGMGAFILLAFMALPFFPNTADHAQLSELTDQIEAAERERNSARERAEQAEAERDRARERAEQVQADRDRAQREADDLARRVSELEVPDVDLVICLDVTFSMVDEIDGLKAQVASLAEILNKVAPTGIGVIAFGDIEWRQPLYVQEVTTDIDTIQDFLNGVEPNMRDPYSDRNFDGPEAVAEALERAERMNWRPESRVHHVVVITDNPAQRRSAALAAASRIASAGDSHVSTLMVRDEPETEAFLRSLADRGDGEFVDGNERTMLGAILLAVLG